MASTRKVGLSICSEKRIRALHIVPGLGKQKSASRNRELT